MINIAGWVLIFLSSFVLVATFPGRTGRILIPSLLPVFGVLFAILYLIAQYALAFYLKSRRGILLVTAVVIVGMGLGGCGRAIDLWGNFARHNISYLQYILCAGACAGGLALGVALVRGWAGEGK